MYEIRHDEDTVGAIQLLPIQWRRYCTEQFEAIEQHVKDHAAPEGTGITEIYRLPADPTLPRLRMTASEFADLLSPHGRKFDRISSALSDLEEALGIRRIGFGTGIQYDSPWRNRGLVAELDGDDVRQIWGKLWTSDPGEQEILADMLAALSGPQHLLLVDWQGERVADLRARDEVLAYLAD